MELLSRFWKRKDPSAFGFFSTAEEVTNGIDGSSLTAIVTGGTSGIGKETVRVLALRGAQVVMPARNMKTGNEVKQAILTENPNAKVNVMELNLASLSSVKNFAQSFSSLGRPLNILINNAGVMGCPFQFSKDGIELQFATNHLGHFLLTNLLLEKIKATARETGIEGRIINVASEAHRRAYPGGIHLDKINDKSSYKSMAAYGQSKVANILHSNELSRRLQAEGVNVTANSLHPGIIPTNIIRYIKIFAIPFAFVKFLLKSVPQGAATTCYLALHPDVKGVSGKYFKDCNESVPNSFAQDSNLAKELWQLSEELVSKAEESA